MLLGPNTPQQRDIFLHPLMTKRKPCLTYFETRKTNQHGGFLHKVLIFFKNTWGSAGRNSLQNKRYGIDLKDAVVSSENSARHFMPQFQTPHIKTDHSDGYFSTTLDWFLTQNMVWNEWNKRALCCCALGLMAAPCAWASAVRALWMSGMRCDSCLMWNIYI